MEDDSTGRPPVAKKAAIAVAGQGQEEKLIDAENENQASAKRARFKGCFSFTGISIDPGVKSLKQLDSKKFKEEIQRWAKRVASYARQLSDHFGSSRRKLNILLPGYNNKSTCRRAAVHAKNHKDGKWRKLQKLDVAEDVIRVIS